MEEQSHSVCDFLNTMIRPVAADDDKSVSDTDEFVDTRTYAFTLDLPASNITNFPAPRMSKFLCKLCSDFVRGGVITICGHLYCWTCLWPKVCYRRKPQCPSCMRPLLLHEDIVPFLSEGPYPSPNEGVVLAQPGNVPRPTGMYLQDHKYPCWFEVNGLEEDDEFERNLPMTVDTMYRKFPRITYWTSCLQWLELICAVLLAVFGFYIMTSF